MSQFDEDHDWQDDPEVRPGKCEVCGSQLGIHGGMVGTDMCGPCCTGESETLGEFGDTW